MPAGSEAEDETPGRGVGDGGRFARELGRVPERRARDEDAERDAAGL